MLRHIIEVKPIWHCILSYRGTSFLQANIFLWKAFNTVVLDLSYSTLS